MMFSARGKKYYVALERLCYFIDNFFFLFLFVLLNICAHVQRDLCEWLSLCVCELQWRQRISLEHLKKKKKNVESALICAMITYQ